MKYIAPNKSKIIKNRYTHLFLQDPQPSVFILITNIHFKTNNNKQVIRKSCLSKNEFYRTTICYL